MEDINTVTHKSHVTSEKMTEIIRPGLDKSDPARLLTYSEKYPPAVALNYYH